MCRLIKGIVIAICLQWSLPAYCADFATCTVSDKQVSPLITNESLPTQLTATESFFKINCSCVGGQALIDKGSMVKLSIIQNQSNVYNGVPGIMSQGNNGGFGLVIPEQSYQVTATQQYEQTYSYFVKVSSLDGELLQAKDYTVVVRIDLSNPPTCQNQGGDAPN
jgi:hypothetical protein